jgi:uncharacterized protein DUF6962
MTVLTDYLLAAACAGLGFVLLKRRQSHYSRGFWALAFLALALAAALGGTWHGFPAPALSRPTLSRLWTLTLFCAGVASFGMLAGSAYAAAAGGVRLALLTFAAVKLAGFTLWIQANQGFIVVILDTGIAMLLVALLHALDRRNAASRWILAGVGASLAGAAVQVGGLALHPHFNHNDLYHVIQIAAMVLYYRGVATMQDRRSA